MCWIVERFLPRTEKQATRTQYACSCCFLIALGLIIVGIYIPLYIEEELRTGLHEAGVLSEGSDAYTTWSGWDKDANTLVVEFYLFDVKNPDEFVDGEKPVVEEIGPFTYTMHRRAFNVTWSEDEEILNYRLWDQYTFLPPPISVDTEERILTSLNMVFVGLWRLLLQPQQQPLGINQLYMFYSGMAERDRLFVTKTVKELIWGYPDGTLDFLHSIMPSVPAHYDGLAVNMTSLSDANARAKDADSIRTGKSDPQVLRQMFKYQGNEFLQACAWPPCPPQEMEWAWGTKEASRVRGSDGSAYHPNVKDTDDLTFFFPNIMRPVTMVPRTKLEHKKLKVIDFRLADFEWQNSQEHPENALYYQDGPTGLFNLTKMLGGVPMYLSTPRFMGTDPSVSDEVIGMWPCEEVDAYMYVEPISGYVMSEWLPLQVNVFVNPIPDMPLPPDNTTTWFPNIRSMYFPVFWANTGAEISDNDANDFATALYGALFIEDLALYGSNGLGGLILILSVAMLVWICRHSKEFKGGVTETSKLLPGSNSAVAPGDSSSSTGQSSSAAAGVVGVTVAVAGPAGHAAFEDDDADDDSKLPTFENPPAPDHAAAGGSISAQGGSAAASASRSAAASDNAAVGLDLVSVSVSGGGPVAGAGASQPSSAAAPASAAV